MKTDSIHSCNVLDTRPEARHLWSFSISGSKPNLSEEWSGVSTAPFPQKTVRKGWRQLYQKKLNIAWLSNSDVFLKILQLPVAEHHELVAMVELQLEKISPLPVHQIVWSIETLPGQVDHLLTVIVVIAARDAVEELLGKIENDQFLPDRIEFPLLHQLYETEVSKEDGAWIYPFRDSEQDLCLVAWRFGGVLRVLQWIRLPAGGGEGDLLVTELSKMAWAGEIEGWLSGPVAPKLVASEEMAGRLVPALSTWSGSSIPVIPPISRNELAEVAARRAAQGQSSVNLLPAEEINRFRQRFIDSLWMRGLGAVVVLYVAAVVLYFGFLQARAYQHRSLEQEVTTLSQTYTNALQLKEHVEVLRNQLDLKYAALDSFQVASQLLPDDLSLTKLKLSSGQVLSLDGTAPTDKTARVTDYVQAMRDATVNGERVFSQVAPPKMYTRSGSISWQFDAELNRPDLE